MKRFLLLFVIACASCASAPAERDVREGDVEVIAAWILGRDTGGVFEHPFADSRFLSKAEEPLLYSDVRVGNLPTPLSQRPYEFVLGRMQAIRSLEEDGGNPDPAVLITTSVERLPEEGEHADIQIMRWRGKPGDRYYYVEVGIGTMAWHWIKVVMRGTPGDRKAIVLPLALS